MKIEDSQRIGLLTALRTAAASRIVHVNSSTDNADQFGSTRVVVAAITVVRAVVRVLHQFPSHRESCLVALHMNLLCPGFVIARRIERIAGTVATPVMDDRRRACRHTARRTAVVPVHRAEVVVGPSLTPCRRHNRIDVATGRTTGLGSGTARCH